MIFLTERALECVLTETEPVRKELLVHLASSEFSKDRPRRHAASNTETASKSMADVTDLKTKKNIHHFRVSALHAHPFLICLLHLPPFNTFFVTTKPTILGLYYRWNPESCPFECHPLMLG